jgi:hypothetical protein
MGGGVLETSPFLLYLVVPASLVMFYVKQTIALLASRLYHGGVNTSIQVHRMATELQYKEEFVNV